MKVRAGDTVRFALPSDARFVPFGAPILRRYDLQFTVTPAMLRQVLKSRRRRERRERRGRT